MGSRWCVSVALVARDISEMIRIKQDNNNWPLVDIAEGPVCDLITVAGPE
jgi:hypothetical protein